MIRSKVKQTEIVIDLTGPQGNAYVLLRYAKDYAKQLGLNFDTVMTEMMSSDYENLIQVFDHYFGDFVVLER